MPFVPEELNTSERIAAYLNALKVKECVPLDVDCSESGAAREWKVVIQLPQSIWVDRELIWIKYGCAYTLEAYCRKTSAPQRTLDVVPLLLMTDEEGTVMKTCTTVSARKGDSHTTIDLIKYANVGLAMPGKRDMIVGAGEHLEAGESDRLYTVVSDMKLEGTSRRTMKGLMKSRTDVDPKPLVDQKGAGANKGLGANGPVNRALAEETGLKLGKHARTWVIGGHTTRDDDVCSRDLRYWPRRMVQSGQTYDYGYRRNNSGIIAVAVLKVPSGMEKQTLAPEDTAEIGKVYVKDWDDVVRDFKDEGSMKPAFGWTHAEMVRIVDAHVGNISEEYMRWADSIVDTAPAGEEPARGLEVSAQQRGAAPAVAFKCAVM
jgi:hypothetical protein